jgi:hypothetical protein
LKKLSLTCCPCIASAESYSTAAANAIGVFLNGGLFNTSNTFAGYGAGITLLGPGNGKPMPGGADCLPDHSPDSICASGLSPMNML